jgi:hypothetical protein
VPSAPLWKWWKVPLGVELLGRGVVFSESPTPILRADDQVFPGHGPLGGPADVVRSVDRVRASAA